MGYKPFDRDWGQTYQSLQFDIEQRVLDIGHPRRRPRVFAEGLLYHVIVRGNHRRPTFRSDEDYTH